jgi:hypothetical protein
MDFFINCLVVFVSVYLLFQIIVFVEIYNDSAL